MVAETRRHHSFLLRPGKLSSIHSPIHLQPWRGKASAAAATVAKAVFSWFHMTPPLSLKSHTTTTTIDLFNLCNNSHASVLESSLKAGAPPRSSVSSGSWPGNRGLTHKRGKESKESSQQRWEMGGAQYGVTQRLETVNTSLQMAHQFKDSLCTHSKKNPWSGTNTVPTDVTDGDNNTTNYTSENRG